jgi:Uma2 family endonuclease
MATDQALRLTPQEYLAFERRAGAKHEYADGELREMVGASLPHNLIACRISSLLDRDLAGRPFLVCQSDLRVRVPGGPYYYPDVVVAPSPPRLEDEEADTLLDPLVIAEVLSPSTEEYDRGEKLDGYRRIPSLTDYLLVSQDRVRVDHYRRSGTEWTLRIVTGRTASIPFPELGCELALVRVYENVPAAG